LIRFEPYQKRCKKIKKRAVRSEQARKKKNEKFHKPAHFKFKFQLERTGMSLAADVRHTPSSRGALHALRLVAEKTRHQVANFRAFDMVSFTTSHAVAVAEGVAHLKHRRLQKKMAVIKAYVKSSGGWKKAFYDRQPKAQVPVFDLLLKDGTWCLQELRMLSGDAIILCQVLRIPQEFRTVNRDHASGIDALCMLLFRLSWPRNYYQLRQAFGGSGHRIARISNALAVHLCNRYKNKLERLDRQRLSDDYLVAMAQAQYRKNGIMQNIVGFIDATVRPCCRPVRFQKEIYNGKDCEHALKYQTVMMADGIICHVSGPWSGRRHDTAIFHQSHLPAALADMPRMPQENGGELMALYADPGILISNVLIDD
jgi:hypothetical protein